MIFPTYCTPLSARKQTTVECFQRHLTKEFRAGIVPDGRRVFTDMTVLENLQIGARSLKKENAGLAKDEGVKKAYIGA